MPHLRGLLGSREFVNRSGHDDVGSMKMRWKFLLSNLVCAVSSQNHPIALVFEDVHWADDDTLGEVNHYGINFSAHHS